MLKITQDCFMFGPPSPVKNILFEFDCSFGKGVVQVLWFFEINGCFPTLHVQLLHDSSTKQTHACNC